MTRLKGFFSHAIITLVLLFCATSPTAAFSTSDLAGTWYVHSLTTGAWMGWETSTTTINSSGYATVNWNDSDGDSGIDIDQIDISSNGIITSQGDPDTHGVMTLDKNFFVVTDTWSTSGNSEYAIGIFVKGGGTFSTSDLAGTWHGHALCTGDLNGWDVSTATINSSGRANISWHNSAGDSGTDVVQLYINSAGIITAQDAPKAHGVMSQDKNLLIITDTWDTSGNGEYALIIYVKSSTNFLTSDLEGTWSGHALATGGWNGWEVLTSTIDSSGKATTTWIDSDGDPGTDTNHQININTNGIMTVPGEANYHGIMSPDKNFWVATDTWSHDSGEFGLDIYIKQPQVNNTVNLSPIINLLLMQNND